MKQPLFITTDDGRYGFSLAGFQQHITDKSGLAPTLEEKLQNQQTELLVLDERLLNEDTEKIVKKIEEQTDSAMVILPPPWTDEKEAEDDYGRKLLTEVLGYTIKIDL